MPEFGAFTFLPIAVILVIAVTTRRTLLALLCGTVTGAVMLGGWGAFNTWVEYTGTALSNETAQWLLLLVTIFGILMTLYERSGFVSDFARWIERFVSSRRRSTVVAFLLSVVLFIDDYLNVLTTGATMKQVTDRYRVPRTLLGSIMKLTAAPIAVIVPVSTWALFFSGLFEAQNITVNGTGFGAYLRAVPFVFFGWTAVAVALLLSLGWLPKLGVIRRDELKLDRADPDPSVLTTNGHQPTEEHSPRPTPQPWSFLIVLAVLIGVTIATGSDIVTGTAASLAVTIVLVLVQRRLRLRELLDTALAGVESMLFIMVLVVLAFMVQEMNTTMKLADFVITVTEPVLSPALLPAIVFAVCGIYAYATGSFWDLAAVITPVVLPLALALGADPIVTGAAVFSGAALGSTTCLYGDGIILASKAIGIKPVTLMLAILPYAGIAAALSLVLYLITGWAMA